ncbi:MAG: OmcA/MtrC family decaheme c-type cytochrome [Burkholderiales bacterium]|nr:OmcA/MtrC family decaheme c-type cytochrome [Burkholderiales bacterium]
MRYSKAFWGGVAVLLATLVGCGSDDDGGGTTPPAGGSVSAQIAAAAGVPANDSATNSSSAFKVLQDAGVPAVVVASAPKVNFTVFSDGAVKQGLTLSNMSFIIAKLVAAGDDSIEEWVSYTYRTEIPAPNVGPGGQPVLASAVQATTDPKPAGQAGQLVYNADGYYTYTFSTDITDPSKTNGVVFEPNRTHRIAIQLSYTNAAGETVRVNPYFDVTFDAGGKSVAVTDPGKTRVMADISSCNGCHDRLALHGGGRVDVQYCVTCHNTGTTDANSGNVLAMSTMTHKIHAGRLLKSKLDAGLGGEQYVIWGYQNSKHDYSHVGFPQDLRNCTVCHDGANPATPQGGNWRSAPSKEACLTCHASKPGSDFYDGHAEFAGAPDPTQLPNSACAGCHTEGNAVGPDRVHWNQNEEHAAKYRMTIESVSYDAASRKVTVKYFLSDPTNNDAKYKLVTGECTGSGASVSCSNQTQFGNLRLYVAYQNLVDQGAAVTEFTAYNNGGSAANAYAYKGANDGSNNYTIEIPLPADTANAVAAGTARVVSIGQVKEAQLAVKTATEPRPEVTPRTLINVVVQNTFMDFAISGALNPRRQVVSNEKCNVCHGALGTTSGSNTLAEAFHGGARNTVESCALCHDALRSSSTVMTSGLGLQESYHFKRMIHGIHGTTRRSFPFTHGNVVQGPFGKDGVLSGGGLFLNDQRVTIGGVSTVVIPAGTQVAAGETFETIAEIIDQAARSLGYTGAPIEPALNYAAEVAYPDLGVNCNLCHVDNSYKVDRSPVGSVVSLRATGANPLGYSVISPQAATCTSCHDSAFAIGHVTSFGGSAFGNRTLGQDRLVREVCADCHAPGLFKGVDTVHGLK